MAIDLSALDVSLEAPPQAAPPAPAKPTGKPLMLCVADIDEDPNQPRKEFSDEAMAEMVASIKARGVKSPVSVRTHPTDAGRWMLNYGARRYRGSLEAGKAEIPAFVDEEHNDYDQVIENEQRENLTPMELALFIQRKLEAGEKKAAIAKKLGKPGEVITHHISLIDAPACIEEAYSTGRTRSPQTIYALRNLHDKHPDAVEAWLAEGADVTRASVNALASQLKGGKAAEPKSLVHEQGISGGSETASTASESAGEGESGGVRAIGEGGEGPAVDKLPYHNTEHEKETKEPTIADPNKIKKPILLVEFDGRAAMVVLTRRPSTPGLLHIKYEDNGDEIEVDAGRCKINCLIESTG